MENKRVNLLITLSIISGTVLLISNLAATKLFNFCGVSMDAGILIFPLSYIVGDLIVEFYGKDTARVVIWGGFAMNLVGMLVLLLAVHLPAYENWTNQEAFATIFGFMPRVVIGSLIAYVVSSLVNNFVFECIRHATHHRHFAARALGSSVIAKFFDIIIFEVIAFAGILSFKEFLVQVLVAYGAGMLLETILTPVTSFIVKLIDRAFNTIECEMIDEGGRHCH